MYNISYGKFIKQYGVFRVADISKPKILIDKMEFPANSIAHIIDNIDSNDVSVDTIDVTNYPFMNKSNLSKMYLYHNSRFENISLLKNDKNKLDYSFKFISPGYQNSIRTFNKENMSLFTPIFGDNALFKLEDKKNCLVIVNHNPLFRFIIRSPGLLRKYYKFDIIFSSMIGFLKTHFNFKHKIIFIPLNHKVIFQKENFISILNSAKVNPAKLEYSSFLYFILIHILAYLSKESKFKSYFDILGEELLNNTNFVFFNEKKQYYLFNMSILKEMCKTNEMFKWKILSGINSLNMSIPIEKIDYLSVQETSPIISNDLSKNLFNTVTKKEIIDSDLSLKKEDEPIIFKDVEKPLSFESNLRNETVEFIDKREDITPEQKERLKTLSTQYKNIPIIINDKKITVEQIVKNKPSNELKKTSHVASLDKLGDTSYAESKILDVNEQYMDTHFHHDLFQNILTLQKGGLFLSDYEEEDIKNSFNMHKNITIKVEDIKGKKHTIKCKIPLLNKDGHFVINGIKSYMKQQLVNLPICKIGPSRVSLSSNYNKTLVEKSSYQRFNFYKNFIQSLNKHNKKYPKELINIKYQTIDFKNIKLPYEYTAIGSNIKSIVSRDVMLFFNYEKRFENIAKIDESLEKKYGVLIGKSLENKNHVFFMDNENKISIVNIKIPRVEDTNYLSNLLLLKHEISQSFDMCHLKILDKNIPIIYILGYIYGIETMLKYLKISYVLVPINKRIEIKSDEMMIRFQDQKLIYKKYPLLKSFILNGLKFFPTIKNYDFASLNIQETYYNLFQDKNLSINYIKGIDNFFTFFIDGVTRDILIQMKEPTNPRDLLIRCVELLVTENYENPAAMVNFRARSMEKVNGIIYNEITRQYGQYLNNKTRDMTFSINTQAIFQRVLQDQSVALVEEVNPIHELKEKTALTYTGFSGRDSESFVERDRIYPKDGIGILSEATPDSGKVSINTYYSFNPNVKDMRGFFETKDPSTDPGNILSVSSAIMPCVTHDDPKRANFANIQISHHVPSQGGRAGRIRTGMESILGNFSSDLYCVAAKMNGEILDIDLENKIVLFKYSDDTRHSFEYGNIMGEVAGTIIHHKIKNMVTKGKKFKKDDILAYNTGFFQYDYIFKTLNWKSGIFGKIAILEKDETLEDASSCSSSFASKFAFNSVYMRPIKITSDLTITKILDIGHNLNYTDSLVELEYSDITNFNLDELDTNIDESKHILQDLNKISIKSKHKGTLVDFKLFYSGEKENFHKSITKIINKYEKEKAKKFKFNKDTQHKEEFLTISKVQPGTRIKNLIINEDEIIFMFYISETISHSVGDKVVVDSSLKSVISNIYDNIETKSGIKIDMLFGAQSIFDRIILSPIKTGIMERIIEKIEDTAIDMYFEK